MKKNVNTQLSHCCGAMKYAVEDPFCYLYYNDKFREYKMRDHKSTSGIIVEYCFHCGTKLPDSLRSLWFDILEKEYNIEDPADNLRKVPKDFKSDVWWKKRGYKDVEDNKCEKNIRKVCF